MAEGHANAQAIFQTEEFLNAIRLDLRHSNSGIRKGWFARLFLQEGAVFLAMAAKDPKASLAALVAAEKEVRAQKEKRAG